MWFKNRRAKFRKQQRNKAMAEKDSDDKGDNDDEDHDPQEGNRSTSSPLMDYKEAHRSQKDETDEQDIDDDEDEEIDAEVDESASERCPSASEEHLTVDSEVPEPSPLRELENNNTDKSEGGLTVNHRLSDSRHRDSPVVISRGGGEAMEEYSMKQEIKTEKEPGEKPSPVSSPLMVLSEEAPKSVPSPLRPSVSITTIQSESILTSQVTVYFILFSFITKPL